MKICDTPSEKIFFALKSPENGQKWGESKIKSRIVA